MKYKIALLTLVTVIMMGCNDGGIPGTPLENSTTIRVDDDLFSNAPNDDVEITQATLAGDSLTLTIYYGGGCGDIYYDLIGETNYQTTNPIQRNIRLAFDDKDNCEALVELALSFDLTPIQVTNSDTIILNLAGWANPIEYIY